MPSWLVLIIVILAMVAESTVQAALVIGSWRLWWQAFRTPVLLGLAAVGGLIGGATLRVFR